MKEALIAITSAVTLFGWGYYCVRWPAKAAECYNHDRKRPLSEGHTSFIGWMMLAIGLVCLYAAVVWITESLR